MNSQFDNEKLPELIREWENRVSDGELSASELLHQVLPSLRALAAIRARSDGEASWTNHSTPPDSREGRMVVLQRDKTGKPTVWCDPEIADLVAALNNGGVPTVASCSGHGEVFGNIALEDGRELWILPNYETARRVERLPGIYTTPAPAPDGRMTWAQGLIEQLPSTHEGRNSWLINHGIGNESDWLRAEHKRYSDAWKEWQHGLPQPVMRRYSDAHARSAGGEGNARVEQIFDPTC
jgi:hypothetical protein